MKIKCRVCKEEFDKEYDMVQHFRYKHTSFRIAQEYARLQFKIHETIVRFEQALDHHYTNDDVIQELKSLLESEK